MADIKTRDVVKGTIKKIDKAAIAADRMRSAYVQTKEKAEHTTHPDEHNAEEYASDVDRLSNFKRAARLKGTTLPQAVTGMMVKHTVSVYDMVESGEAFTAAAWDEKIGDHINYLILLKATLIEDGLYVEPAQKRRRPAKAR